MAGYASTKLCASVSMQTGTFSFMTGVDLCSKYRIKGLLPLSHTHIMRSHICSHGNGNIFTVIKTMNCYQNILVYLAMSHMHVHVTIPVVDLLPTVCV